MDKIDPINSILALYTKAVELFNKLEGTSDITTWMNRGISLYGAGHYDRAMKCFDKVLEINPEFSEGFIRRGR
jgi:tetratricopeptide (TPR) repeat protein